jgi:hypothetical protein
LSSASLAAGSRRNESAASATARRPRLASFPWTRKGEHGRGRRDGVRNGARSDWWRPELVV